MASLLHTRPPYLTSHASRSDFTAHSAPPTAAAGGAAGSVDGLGRT